MAASKFPIVPDFTKMLNVVVGDGGFNRPITTFAVPEQLLVDKSEFFKAACRNEWKEASSRTVKLPEVEAETFQAYLLWVYRDQLGLQEATREAWAKDSCANCIEDGIMSLVKLSVLGEFLLDTMLRNRIIDAILGAAKDDWSRSNLEYPFLSPRVTDRIWRYTIVDSPLRRLALDFQITNAHSEAIRHFRPQYNTDLLEDVMSHAVDMTSGLLGNVHPHDQPKCHYHEHDEANPKCPQPFSFTDKKSTKRGPPV